MATGLSVSSMAVGFSAFNAERLGTGDFSLQRRALGRSVYTPSMLSAWAETSVFSTYYSDEVTRRLV